MFSSYDFSFSFHFPRSFRSSYLSSSSFIVFNHLVFLWVLFFFRPVAWGILAYTIFQAWLNLLGITAGAHRLWSHRSYEAHWTLRLFLSIIALQAFQGSIQWWVEKHRVHHRFVDTPLDPHSTNRGLWWAHCGWLFAPSVEIKNFHSLVPVDDLKQDFIVKLQAKYLLIGYILFGALLPSVQGWVISGDWLGGLLWIGFVGRVISYHCIWSINSLSHWKGEKRFSKTSSAVHVPIIAILQNGEGKTV
jgi:stearoyl-CoA desaturase (delta-9 desaturase)